MITPGGTGPRARGAASGPRSDVYLGLGSNLEPRRAYLAAALAHLARTIQVLACSRVYDTAPVGVEAQPRFLNLVLEGRTGLEPEALLARLRAIEAAVGRRPAPARDGPRVIDIDLLLFGHRRVDTPDLTLPHPRMFERRFVLAPLAELAPDLVPPGLDDPVAALAAAAAGDVRPVGWLRIP